MNSASSSRSSSPSVRRSSRTSCPGRHAIDVVGRRADGRHRSPRNVAWAPQPKPSHSPSCQYFKIVTRAARRRPGHVRNFILLEPGAIEPRQPFEIHRRRIIVRRHRPAGRAPFRRAAAHSGKSPADTATRDRAAASISASTDASHSAGALARQPHHQVEAEVVESRRPRQRAPRPARSGTNAAGPAAAVPRRGRIGHRNSGDWRRRRESRRASSADDDSGLASSVISASARQREAVAAGLDDAAELRRFEQRRRAAAKKNGVGLDRSDRQSARMSATSAST